MNQEP